MKPLIVLCVLWCCYLGCADMETPSDAPKKGDVHVVHPIAKFIKAVPEGGTLLTGETITLHFTEVPEHLKIQARPTRYTSENPRGYPFVLQILDYNGNTAVTLSFVPNLRSLNALPRNTPRNLDRDLGENVRISISWKHGYKALDFELYRK